MSDPLYHYEFRQLTPEWAAMHLGRPTSSSFSSIMDTSFNLRKSEGVKTFIYEKCAEMFRGKCLPDFTSFVTDEGLLLEDEARQYFTLETDHEVKTCGFIESADRRSGCSPDGLIGEDGGLEMKCCQVINHVRYLIEGKLPSDYIQQVHGSIYVSGRKWWKFYSYRRGFPSFIIKIERDEEIMKKIGVAMDEYYELFNRAYSKLKSYMPDKK